MTAYIKMIDIWLILAMIYPFCIVTLFSILEYLKGKDRDIPVAMKIEKRTRQIKKAVQIVNFLLDLCLPVFFIIFIIIFWILGMINTNS